MTGPVVAVPSAVCCVLSSEVQRKGTLLPSDLRVTMRRPVFQSVAASCVAVSRFSQGLPLCTSPSAPM